MNSSDCLHDGLPLRRRDLRAAATKVERLIAVMVAALVTLAAATTAMAAPADKRELQAREAFAAGRYNDALDLYAKLYAEKLHPTYLRNVGRCYQNLGDPDHAISSFREYLRQAKDVTPTERAQVEGYIAEMEALKRQREADVAAKAAKPALTPPTPAAAVPAAPPPSVLLNQPPPAPAESPPFYKRGLFWGVVAGAVVLGTVGILAGTGAFSSDKKDAPCPLGVACRL